MPEFTFSSQLTIMKIKTTDEYKPFGTKMNILLLMADQFRFDAMRCAGNTSIHTPNLDELAASGQRFTHAFTPSPVCVAARMSLITGQRIKQTHFAGNGCLSTAEPVLPTLMNSLHDAGYRTQAVGKMHFRGKHYGFHDIKSQEECPDTLIDDDYLLFLQKHDIRTRFPHGYRNLLYFQPQTTALPEPFTPETWVANQSMKFLTDHLRNRGSKPFFLWSSWIAPHPPFAACEPYDTMYSPDEVDWPDYTNRPLSDLPETVWSNRARLDGALLDPERMRRIKALYYGKVSHVDDCVGRLLRHLEELGLADDTIVIFTSDHGEMLGDHGLAQKQVPYEASIRIPFIVRWPKVTQSGQTSADLVTLLDLFPTLIDALDLPYAGNIASLAGKSLYHSVKNSDTSITARCLSTNRNRIFIDLYSGKNRWIAVRTHDKKYVAWASGGREEFYDLVSDPNEHHNLADQQPEQAAQFRAEVINWERANGLSDTLDEDKLKTYPESAPPTEQACRGVVINQGQWAENWFIDEQADSCQQKSVETYAEAIRSALSKETFDLNSLSVETYMQKTGHPITDIVQEKK